jgi:hypothetical protein
VCTEVAFADLFTLTPMICQAYCSGCCFALAVCPCHGSDVQVVQPTREAEHLRQSLLQLLRQVMGQLVSARVRCCLTGLLLPLCVPQRRWGVFPCLLCAQVLGKPATPPTGNLPSPLSSPALKLSPALQAL